MQERIGRYFNVRKDESLHVTYLLFHYFFQGIGLALLFTVASAMFLAHFSVEELPLVFICSSICMLGLGKVSEIAGRHWSTPQTLKAITIFITGTVFILYLATVNFTWIWIPIALYICYQVIESQIDTEFWSLSSNIFDVRQAKRLYGLISVGDVPAKLLGFLSIEWLAPRIGIPNLILISTASFMVGAILLNRLLSKIKPHHFEHNSGGRNQESVARDQEEHIKQYNFFGFRINSKGKARSIIIRFFQSDFVLVLSILYFVGAVTLTFTEFSFLAGVEHKFHTEEELANFFAYVGTIVNTIIIICKLFVSSKAIERLGVRRSLVLLPSFIAIACITIAITWGVIGKESPLLWIFASMVIFNDVFKAVLYQPLFLALFQPLPTQIRHHAHNIINDFVGPIGLFISGLALYIGLRIYDNINLYKIDYLLLGLAIVWIIMVLITSKKYMTALRSAINNRLIDDRQLKLGDEKSINILKAKLKSSRPDEVIYTAEMLSKTLPEVFELSVPALLVHEVQEVRIYVLNKIDELKLKVGSEELYRLIISDSSIKVRELAVKIYCSLYEDIVDRITPMLDHPQLVVRSAAIKGFLKSGDLEAVIIGGQQLLLMLQSKGEQLVAAINIIGDLGFKNYYKPLLELLHHEEYQVRVAAIEACGSIDNPKLIPYLVPCLADKTLKKITLNSLSLLGEPVLEYIMAPEFENKYIEETIKLCARIGSDKSTEIIFLKYFNTAKAEILDEVLKALNRLNFDRKTYHHSIETKLNEELHLGHSYLLMLSFLEHEEKTGPVYNALNEGFKNLKTRLFLLLALIYDRKTIGKARNASFSSRKEMRANALEYLDNVVGRELKLKLFPLLEEISIDEKLTLLAKVYTGHSSITFKDVLSKILTPDNSNFLLWTKAITIYNHFDNIETDILEYYKSSTIKLLRECAYFALYKKGQSLQNIPANKNHGMKTKTHEYQDSMLEIEKVLILKSTSMFAGTPENILVGIAGISYEEKIQKGDDIFRKDDLGNCLYIICEGDISIHIAGKQLSVLHSRDIFGELALLDPEPRSATATAINDCLLLRIDQGAFNELIEDRPEVAQGILTILSKRIRGQNAVIQQLRGLKTIGQ